MTAKEKQAIVVKSCLKPLFKQHGYFNNGQTWWFDQGEFFKIINLQNFSFNTQEDVTFCFNIGVGLKKAINPQTKKPTVHDLTVFIRDGGYLPDSRNINRYKNNTGYVINPKTNIDDFIKEIKIDFEDEILPLLDRLKTLKDCLDYYQKFPFWGDHLKKVIDGSI